MHRTQREFLSEHLPRYLDACDAAGVLALRSSATTISRRSILTGSHSLPAAPRRSTSSSAGTNSRAATGSAVTRSYPTTPFGLKDWCLRDLPESTPVPTRRPVITTRGVEEIADSAAFFASRPTMGEHLATLVDPALPMERCILVSHAPFGLGLGLLHTGEDVGSHAVRAFIERHQPLLTRSQGTSTKARMWAERGRAFSCHTTRFGRTTLSPAGPSAATPANYQHHRDRRCNGQVRCASGVEAGRTSSLTWAFCPQLS